MSDDLEPAIRQLFDATNRGDSEAFLDAFAVSGDGYNGGGAFTFTLSSEDGKIARMVITG